MKTKTLLLAAVMLLVFSAAASAQVTYRVFSIPTTTVVESGYAEEAGDITFTTDGEELTVSGTITIEYTLPPTVTYADIVMIPDPDDPGSLPTVTIDAVEETYKVILKIVPATVDPAVSYGFRLQGVRVPIAGDPGATPTRAYITAVGNLIRAGEDYVTVINDQRAGLASLTGNGPIYANNVFGEASGTVTLDVYENFRHAFPLTIATRPTGNTNQKLRFSLTPAPLPAGVYIQFPAYDESGIWERIGDGYLTSADGSNPYVEYRLIADPDILEREHVYFDVDVQADENFTGAYLEDAVKAWVSLAPIETASGSSVPRYYKVNVGPAQLLAFYPASTTLMIPYAITAVGYDTGFAIANTTLDPGDEVMGFSGAVPQDGKIVFYFYPNEGAPFSFDTSSGDAPNADLLDANGKLKRGKSYIAMIGQVLEAAGFDDPFQGYVIMVCDFTNAHGQYFISNWYAPEASEGKFVNGAQMLVLNSRFPWISVDVDVNGEIDVELEYHDPGRLYGTEGADH
jgi:hypothetical protein